jgi:hypothetical protein
MSKRPLLYLMAINQTLEDNVTPKPLQQIKRTTNKLQPTEPQPTIPQTTKHNKPPPQTHEPQYIQTVYKKSLHVI